MRVQFTTSIQKAFTFQAKLWLLEYSIGYNSKYFAAAMGNFGITLEKVVDALGHETEYIF